MPLSSPNTLEDTIEDIIENFSLLDEWEDKYRYVIELGRQLPLFPENEKNEANKVQGCVSQVWLIYQQNGDNDPILTFQGDSDGQIVRGLVYIILALYSGKTASEIINIDIDAMMKTLGLDENLTKQRSNGLKSLVAKINSIAQSLIK